jgi:hypothetical protein
MISLRYKLSEIDTAVIDGSSYDADPSDLDYDVCQMDFEGVETLPAFSVINTDKGGLLNGSQYSNILNSTNEYEITISADEIDNTAMEFLIRFWLAPYKYISYDYGNYIEVISDGGRLPVTYINNNELLPEVAFKFTKVNP